MFKSFQIQEALSACTLTTGSALDSAGVPPSDPGDPRYSIALATVPPTTESFPAYEVR